MMIQRKVEYRKDHDWKVFCSNVSMHIDCTFHIPNTVDKDFRLEKYGFSTIYEENKFVTVTPSRDVLVKIHASSKGSPSWVNFAYNQGKLPHDIFPGQLYLDNTVAIAQKMYPICTFEIVSMTTPKYKIFKYQIPIKERTHIDLPLGAQILRVDGLDGGLWVWAMVDTTAPLERREFALFKTGGSMPDNVAEEYKYVGCGAIHIQQELMLYVFEKVSRE